MNRIAPTDFRSTARAGVAVPGGAIALALAGLLLAAAAPLDASADGSGGVAGRVTVEGDGLAPRDAGAIVVFLAPPPGSSASVGAPAESAMAPAVVRQNGARFDPPFLAVARGQTVEMPNDDVIFHNVFSYSEPNAFDLGMYPSGQSRSVRFAHAGLVRIYCSIHEAMDGLIFVAPTRHFARADAEGRYAIPGVPPGRWQLHVFSERLPERTLAIEVSPGAALTRDLAIGLTAR